MLDLIYIGCIDEIPMFIDKTIKKETAYLVDLKRVYVGKTLVHIGDKIILINNLRV